MANAEGLSNPAAGQIPTGNVSASGQTQQAISEPTHQGILAGQDLINTAIAGDDPNYLQALRNADNAIVGQMQQRWWKSQDEQFVQTHGQTYSTSSQQLQSNYMDELARAADITDPWERDSAMNAAHGRMWNELGKLDEAFLDQAGKYASNPIIGNRAARLLKQRRETIAKIAGEQAEPAKQTEALSRAEAAQAQAGHARAQGETAGGFYSTRNAQSAATVPVNKATDWIVTRPGGREELQKETQQLLMEREQILVPALRQYQEAMASGNMKLANQVKNEFKRQFLVDPEMLGDEEGEELLNLWRSEAVVPLRKQAAENVYNRLIDASRGFQAAPDTSAPQAPGGGQPLSARAPESPQVGTPGATKKPVPSILAGGESEAKLGFARGLEETRDLPEFDVGRAAQAMGGNTPEEIEVKGQKAYNFMAQQMIREGLEPPPEWDADPSVEVTTFAQDAYSAIPTYREETKKRAGLPGKMQKYFDTISDQVRAVFMLPKTIPGLPEGLDRNDIIWMNLITLHAQFLRKFPESDASIEQLVQGALANVAQRETSKQKLEERNKRTSKK
jgi:hypothetical protein